MADIKFVYFDLGNILVSFDPDVACANVAQLLGVTPSQAIRAVYDTGLEVQYEYGRLEDQQFLDETAKVLGVESSHVALDEFLTAIADMFVPIEAMAPVVRHIRQIGLRAGILSNTCSAHWRWIRRQNWSVSKLDFDEVILSYEVGSMKPETKIYEVAEQKALVTPEEICFIDDRQENVDAALNRGWQAIQCFGGDDAIGKLTNLGLLD